MQYNQLLSKSLFFEGELNGLKKMYFVQLPLSF